MNIEKTLSKLMFIGNVKLTTLIILTLTIENVWVRACLLFYFVVTFVKTLQLGLDLKLGQFEEVKIERFDVDDLDGDVIVVTNEYEYILENARLGNPDKCRLRVMKYSKIPIEIIDAD